MAKIASKTETRSAEFAEQACTGGESVQDRNLTKRYRQ